jgi:hypothetical protein
LLSLGYTMLDIFLTLKFFTCQLFFKISALSSSLAFSTSTLVSYVISFVHSFSSSHFYSEDLWSMASWSFCSDLDSRFIHIHFIRSSLLFKEIFVQNGSGYPILYFRYNTSYLIKERNNSSWNTKHSCNIHYSIFLVRK